MHEPRDCNVAPRLGSAVNSIEHTASGSIQTRLSDGRNVTSEMLLSAAGVSAPPTGSISKRQRSKRTVAAGIAVDPATRFSTIALVVPTP